MTALEPADEPDLLVAEPLGRTEIKIGYARVSTGGQKLERQLDALTAAGCRKIFADKKSGKNAPRPELKACHAFLDPGDTLVVPSLDRYGRSLQDLINMVAELRERGIGFTSLHENLDTTTPAAGSSSTSSPPSRLSQARRSSRAVTWAARSRTLSSTWPLNVFEARSARADRY
ncbi:recombinase family protein [Streptomyces sp. NPDC059928]|uniref:recombinase family protein n=1 Tax=unclassified Streptomyces TaxID=2593676 RepID=UPI0036628496